MTNVNKTFIAFVLLSPLAALGCDTGDSGKMIATSNNAALLIYPFPYMANMAQPNPIAIGVASAAAIAWEATGGLRLRLTVTGMPPNRAFGAHLHALPCEMNKAGGHYQHNPFPPTSNANDPAYGNPSNEAWLDFATGADGRAQVETTVAWLPAAGARAIIIHDMRTDVNARAGDKLACLPMTF